MHSHARGVGSLSGQNQVVRPTVHLRRRLRPGRWYFFEKSGPGAEIPVSAVATSASELDMIFIRQQLEDAS